MKVELNKYAVNKTFIQKFYRTNKELYSLGSTISLCATGTGCPCIVVVFYLGEDIGFTPEILEAIDRFVEFYGYTEFLDAPESYYAAIQKKSNSTVTE